MSSKRIISIIYRCATLFIFFKHFTFSIAQSPEFRSKPYRTLVMHRLYFRDRYKETIKDNTIKVRRVSRSQESDQLD